MKERTHFEKLVSMYQSAPINTIFKPSMSVKEGWAEIEIDIDQNYHHPAGGVHGAVYFKMLDDAAFFAAASLEEELFVLTTSFTTYITRPVSKGKMRSVGKVVNSTKSQFISESIVYNSDEREIGRGRGIFVRGKMYLKDVGGYS